MGSSNEVMVPKEKLLKGTPFSRHKHRKKADGKDDVTEFGASASKIIAPVSFVALFRYFKIDHLPVVYLY
jgi:putative transposon-encoded protein